MATKLPFKNEKTLPPKRRDVAEMRRTEDHDQTLEERAHLAAILADPGFEAYKDKMTEWNTELQMSRITGPRSEGLFRAFKEYLHPGQIPTSNDKEFLEVDKRVMEAYLEHIKDNPIGADRCGFPGIIISIKGARTPIAHKLHVVNSRQVEESLIRTLRKRIMAAMVVGKPISDYFPERPDGPVDVCAESRHSV